LKRRKGIWRVFLNHSKNLLSVKRTFNTKNIFPCHMGVDHGGVDVFVTEEFLHCSQVIAVFKQVRGKAVPKGVHCGRLRDTGLFRSPSEGPL